MIFNEYDTIKTLVDKNNISKGTVGTIVLCHKSNDDYEIEFCNSDGETIEQIARILQNDCVPIPKALYARRKGTPEPDNPYLWCTETIRNIISRQEYTGCICNFKTYSKSYKLKKRYKNETENMVIIPDAQEAIVTQEQWDRAQELRQHRRRQTSTGRQSLFAGLLFCGDCGHKLNLMRKHKEKEALRCKAQINP